MPLTGIAESHQEEDRSRSRRRDRYVIAAATLSVLASGATFWLVGALGDQVAENKVHVAEIREAQEDSRIRGLKLRAIGCRTIEELGGSFPVGDPCREREIAPYFLPTERQ